MYLIIAVANLVVESAGYQVALRAHVQLVTVFGAGIQKILQYAEDVVAITPRDVRDNVLETPVHHADADCELLFRLARAAVDFQNFSHLCGSLGSGV